MKPRERPATNRLSRFRAAIRLFKQKIEKDNKTEEGPKLTRRELLTRPIPNWWRSLSPTQRMGIETLLVFAGGIAADRVINQKLNKEIEVEAQKHPVGTWEKLAGIFVLTTYVPILEEALFRVFPSSLVDKYLPKEKGKVTWKYGIPISLLFAAAHIPNTRKFKNRYIPVSQFLAGCYFWRLMRKQPGLNALSHAELNLLGSILDWNTAYYN